MREIVICVPTEHIQTVHYMRTIQVHEELVRFVGPSYNGLDRLSHLDEFLLRHEHIFRMTEFMPCIVYGR